MILSYDLRVVGEQDVARALASVEARFVRHQRVINQTLAQGGVTASRARRSPGGVSTELATSQRAMVKSFDQSQRLVFESTKRYEATSHRLKLRNIETQKREEIAKIRATTRAAQREQEAAQRTFRRGIGTGGTNAIKKLTSVGMAGAAMIGVGGAALAGSAVSESLKLDEMSRRLSVAGRGAGEQGRDPEQLRKQFTTTGLQTGIAPEQLAGAASGFVAKTGDIDTAMQNLKNFAIVAQATGASVEDVASAGADLAQKFDIKSAKDMGDALAVLAFQGKKGAFELKDMAEQFPEMAAAAQRAGLKGVGGMRTLGGLAQIARQSTGSGAEASTAVQMMMTQLTNKSGDLHSGKALGGKAVDVFQGGDPTKAARDLPTVLGEIISKSHGNMEQLSKLFDVRGIRAVSPMITAYQEASTKAGGGAKGEAAGKEAVLAMIKDASDASGQFADVQKDAADVMKASSIQLDMAIMELKQMFAEELLPTVRDLLPHVKDLGPPFRAITENALKLASALLNSPMAGVGAIMAAGIASELAKAQLASLVTTGIVSPLGAAGLAATAFTGALVAAKLWVDEQFAKAKQKVEGAAASGQVVRDKASAELDATGKISPDTMKQLQALKATEDRTAAASTAVGQEGLGATAGRAWQEWFGHGKHDLQEKATLLTAGGNEKYTEGRMETNRLLQVGQTAQGMSAADAKSAFGAVGKAAEKLDAVADKLGKLSLNRTDSPSPVKPTKS